MRVTDPTQVVNTQALSPTKPQAPKPLLQGNKPSTQAVKPPTQAVKPSVQPSQSQAPPDPPMADPGPKFPPSQANVPRRGRQPSKP